MSRSPWRDALDMQMKIIRELHKDAAIVHLSRNSMVPEVMSLQQDDIKGVVITAGKTLAEGLECLIREAEPTYITHDIASAVMRTLDRLALDPEAAWPNEPLTEAMLPIPRGLIAIPGAAGFEIQDIPRTDRSHFSVFVRAIYFGDPIALTMIKRPNLQGRFGMQIDVSSDSNDESRIGMGVVVFLDARRSGFDGMTKQFGDHLVPVILGEWKYGNTLDQTLERDASLPKPDAVDQRGTAAIIAVVGLYLTTLFRMMLTRITLWGSVRMNRDEQRDAEQMKLRPRVQLVTWRKANYQYPEGHIPVPKNWSCRWSVKEHYRRYRDGRTVKIKSYIKGPPDKEFRLPIQRAHQVKR